MIGAPARRVPLRHAIVALAMTLLAPGTATATETGAGPRCRQIEVAVALTEGGPKDQRIVGDLCEPRGVRATIIQLLVHGITYNAGYWSFPDPSGGTDRYNYVAHANRAGFATLAIDRVGSTRSSKPLSTDLTIDSNAHSVHQVVQAIRSGAIHRSGGGRFAKVVYVGHSYGTWTGWFEVGRYGDVDAAVFTAASSKAAPTALANALSALYPATLDPTFRDAGLDPGYLTTLPNTRYQAFYAPAEADPAVISHDEATKSTVTFSELANFRDILTTPHDIRVPVLLVAGEQDSLFCRENFHPFPAGAHLDAATRAHEDRTVPETGDVVGLRFGATRCDTPAELIADERKHLGPNIPVLDAYVLPGAGHDLNQAPRAPEFFAATQRWIREQTGAPVDRSTRSTGAALDGPVSRPAAAARRTATGRRGRRGDSGRTAGRTQARTRWNRAG